MMFLYTSNERYPERVINTDGSNSEKQISFYQTSARINTSLVAQQDRCSRQTLTRTINVGEQGSNWGGKKWTRLLLFVMFLWRCMIWNRDKRAGNPPTPPLIASEYQGLNSFNAHFIKISFQGSFLSQFSPRADAWDRIWECWKCFSLCLFTLKNTFRLNFG